MNNSRTENDSNADEWGDDVDATTVVITGLARFQRGQRTLPYKTHGVLTKRGQNLASITYHYGVTLTGDINI